MDNLTMNTMGGTIGLKGSFNTKDHHKPKMDFSYNLKEIDVKQLAENFLTIEKLAPIAKYTSGKISSNFEMKSDLTANLEPIFESLSGFGDLSTETIKISGYKPMEKLSESLNISKLSSQTLKDVKAKFQFADGKVTIKPFTVKMGKINTTISGFTSFDQKINYELKMLIPKEDIPASLIKTAEQAISKVNALSPKLNLGSIPDVLPVKVGLGGTVTDPKITNNFKESLLEATGNLKKELVDKIKEAVKDTVKALVDEKVKEVKEDLNAKKKEILDNAQKEADKLKAEAKKLSDGLRTEASKQADELLQQAGANPLKQKAAKITGDKLKKVAEEKAQKIENESNQKADQIMSTARQKADAIN
jgi:gas vesicle protein